MNDLRLGLRRLLAAPGFTTAALATLALGIWASALTRVLDSLLFDISAGDISTSVFVALTLATAALAACVPPAWKAASVDPAITLRAE